MKQSDYIKEIEKYNNTNSKKVAVIPSFYGMREVVNRNGFSGNKKIIFEKELFQVPEKYDEYLTSVYGNYMELPPVEKRIEPHNAKSYYKK